MMVDPVTCESRANGSWDVWASLNETYAMRDFLMEQDNGTLIVGVTMDDVAGWAITYKNLTT